MLRGNEQQKVVNRYHIVVFPESGKLAPLVWLPAPDAPGKYQAADPALQLLPPNMQEQRLLSVQREKFKIVFFVWVPEPDAFALMRIPQGQALAYTPELERLATIKEFTAKQVQELELNLRAISEP